MGGLRKNFVIAERMKRNHNQRLFPNCYFWRSHHNKPLALFEAKESGREIAPAIRHFGRMLKIPCYQIVRDLDRAAVFPDGCFPISAASFLMLTG